MIRLLLAFLLSSSAWAEGFDHAHAAWDAQLKKHVVVSDGGRASQVRYAGFAKDRAALRAYLETLSGVPEADFTGWSKPQRMAFLINAYNAYTVEKVLMRYPDLKSIRDFGRLIGNPFKDEFIPLFGRRYSLDGIEHDTLRRKGAYDEPRLHFALNCASVGCPMLREEAYVAARLETQLEDQARRFLSDPKRNRYRDGKLELSRIFDWYREDFVPLAAFLGRYFPDGAAPITFLEYDWTLNDFPSSSRR